MGTRKIHYSQGYFDRFGGQATCGIHLTQADSKKLASRNIQEPTCQSCLRILDGMYPGLVRRVDGKLRVVGTNHREQA